MIRIVAPDAVTEMKVKVDKMVDNALRTIGSKGYKANVLPQNWSIVITLYAIWKIVLPVNDKCEFSFGTNFGYGIFNDKYETAKGTFEADKVYSLKMFVKLDYKNFFVDLSAMVNIIPKDAKINTENEGVKHLERSITYDVIMVGIGYKFVI